MKSLSPVFVFALLSLSLFAQNDTRVEPANWWTGMKHNQVELMVHRKGVGENEGEYGKEV